MKKIVDILVLDADAARGAERCAGLAGVGLESVEVQARNVTSSGELAQAMIGSTVSAVVLHLAGEGEAGIDQEVLTRFARQAAKVAILVISPPVDIDRELEWVHRGVQDVLPESISATDLLRNLLLAMERKRLLSDAHEALRLEQENVVKMQGFVDELVGFATRSATGSR